MQKKPRIAKENISSFYPIIFVRVAVFPVKDFCKEKDIRCGTPEVFENTLQMELPVTQLSMC